MKYFFIFHFEVLQLFIGCSGNDSKNSDFPQVKKLTLLAFKNLKASATDLAIKERSRSGSLETDHDH